MSILQFHLDGTGIDAVNCILNVQYFLFHGLDNILNRRDFDDIFRRYLENNCRYQDVIWNIDGQKISVRIHLPKASIILRMEADCETKKMIISFQAFTGNYYIGEVDLSTIKFTTEQFDFIVRKVEE